MKYMRSPHMPPTNAGPCARQFAASQVSAAAVAATAAATGRKAPPWPSTSAPARAFRSLPSIRCSVPCGKDPNDMDAERAPARIQAAPMLSSVQR